MGIHEWFIQRKYRYEVVPELHDWLTVYRMNQTNRVRPTQYVSVLAPLLIVHCPYWHYWDALLELREVWNLFSQ